MADEPPSGGQQRTSANPPARTSQSADAAQAEAVVSDVVRDAEEQAAQQRTSRGSDIIVDPEEAELLELVRAYLFVAIVTGTFTSMVCHITGKCRPLYTWMIAVTILPAWALMVFLFPMLPYLVLALLLTSFYEAMYFLIQYMRGEIPGVQHAPGDGYGAPGRLPVKHSPCPSKGWLGRR